MSPRSGIGFDVHRFETGRRLVLGGVEIPHPRGLAGHSDADVVIHAVCDALLGAAALGDIGLHFPNDDPEWQDADSMALLERVVEMVGESGWRVENVDATVVAEAPRLAPHVPEMCRKISRAIGVERDRVSVKATTAEEMGFVGREEGIAALATACLVDRPSGTAEPPGSDG